MVVEIFTWNPTEATLPKEGFRIMESQFESGAKQIYNKGKKPRRWNLIFRTTYATMCEIRDFWRARRGAYEPFLWKDPETGEYVKVRFSAEDFEPESLWTRTRRYLTGSFSLTIEEVLG